MTRTLSLAALLLAYTSAHADDATTRTFWAALEQHCGQAYQGQRVVARDDREDLLVGNETLIVHFRECTDELLALPFHIQHADGSWDRSRTWRFTRSNEGTGLELRHDHRLSSGEPDEENTFYGGYSYTGDGEIQRFLFTDRTGDDGQLLGWQIEIVPGVRYTYGTFRGADWTWRLDFDLSSPISELPPPPWGFD